MSHSQQLKTKGAWGFTPHPGNIAGRVVEERQSKVSVDKSRGNHTRRSSFIKDVTETDHGGLDRLDPATYDSLSTEHIPAADVGGVAGFS